MSKRRNIGLGVGGSSLLMVFIIVCLTTFATLSLLSANADYKLSNKTAQAVTAYYDADSRAVERVAAIKRRLPAGEAAIVDADLADSTAEGYTFSEAINDRQMLVVTMAEREGSWRITTWQIQNNDSWAGDEQLLNIWDGL